MNLVIRLNGSEFENLFNYWKSSKLVFPVWPEQKADLKTKFHSLLETMNHLKHNQCLALILTPGN